MRLLKLVLCSVIAGVILIISFYKIAALNNGLKSELTTVYGILPVLIIIDTKRVFLDTLPGDTPAQGGSFGPVVALYNIDEAKDTLLHELAHVRQFYRYGLFLSTPLYFNSQRYRVKFEYEAYMAEKNKLSDEEFIVHMRNYYDISLTDKEICTIIENV